MKSSVQNNNEELETHKLMVCEFFQDCKNKKLLLNTVKEQNVLENIQTRAEISDLTDQAIEKIRIHRNRLKNNGEESLLDQKEYEALQASRIVDFIRGQTEELKNLLPLIFDPSKIKTHTQLGTYLREIYEKLDYKDEERSKMNTVFQKDLRNALSHNNYWYDIQENHVESITWQNSDKKPNTWKRDEWSKSISKIENVHEIVSKIFDGDF